MCAICFRYDCSYCEALVSPNHSRVQMLLVLGNSISNAEYDSKNYIRPLLIEESVRKDEITVG